MAIHSVPSVANAQLKVDRFIAELLVDHRRVQDRGEEEEFLVLPVGGLVDGDGRFDFDVGRSHVHAVGDLGANGDQKSGSIRDSFTESGVQTRVFVDERVVSGGAVKMDESRSVGGQESWKRANCRTTSFEASIHTFLPFLTLLSIVGDGFQVDEMRSNYGRFHGIVVPELQLHPLAQWREHFRENELLVPHRSVTVLLHTSFALETSSNKNLFERSVGNHRQSSE